MKKFMSILLSMTIAFCIAVPAFAAELNQDSASGASKVVYKAGQTTDDKGTTDPSDDSVSGTYTVTIPDYIEAAEKGTTPVAQNVIAKNVLIPYGTSLNITVDFDNSLKLTENASTVLVYEMQANPQSAGSLNTIHTGDTILTVAAGNPDVTTTSGIAAVLTQAPSYSGTYTNTATFNISVK